MEKAALLGASQWFTIIHHSNMNHENIMQMTHMTVSKVVCLQVWPNHKVPTPRDLPDAFLQFFHTDAVVPGDTEKHAKNTPQLGQQLTINGRLWSVMVSYATIMVNGSIIYDNP